MKHSAGILLYRKNRDGQGYELLLVRPGGPLWANKREHEFGVVKGLFDPAKEDSVNAAKREWKEETGAEPPTGDLFLLGLFATSKSKTVHVYVAEGQFDETTLVSNEFEMEWPPGSGQVGRFPEVDKAEWIDLACAEARLHKGQASIASAMRSFLSKK